jgi:hypothetical protein
MKITNISTFIEIIKHWKRKKEARAQSGPAQPSCASRRGMAGRPSVACLGAAWCFVKRPSSFSQTNPQSNSTIHMSHWVCKKAPELASIVARDPSSWIEAGEAVHRADFGHVEARRRREGSEKASWRWGASVGARSGDQGGLWPPGHVRRRRWWCGSSGGELQRRRGDRRRQGRGTGASQNQGEARTWGRGR